MLSLSPQLSLTLAMPSSKYTNSSPEQHRDLGHTYLEFHLLTMSLTFNRLESAYEPYVFAELHAHEDATKPADPATTKPVKPATTVKAESASASPTTPNTPAGCPLAAKDDNTTEISMEKGSDDVKIKAGAGTDPKDLAKNIKDVKDSTKSGEEKIKDVVKKAKEEKAAKEVVQAVKDANTEATKKTAEQEKLVKEEKAAADAKVADAKADAAESQKQTAETNKQITALREEKAENQRKH